MGNISIRKSKDISEDRNYVRTIVFIGIQTRKLENVFRNMEWAW